jgi:chemotaxis protein MotB
MRNKQLILACLSAFILSACVSSKEYKTLQVENDNLKSNYDNLTKSDNLLQNDLKNCNTNVTDIAKKKAACEEEINALNKQIAFLKENNTMGLKQLQDLSVITSTQAESIKKSLDNIGAKDAYIQSLQESLAKKDSLNMMLMTNLKGAVGDMNDAEINIKVEKGVVYIDISDKLLFQSGEYAITEKAQEVLGKVAKVLKSQPEIEFMIEGHTDNEPYRRGPLLDNWDLSVKRATAVVRILQNQYGLDPAHITAAGRGEYLPIASDDTPEGRAANRRTRIIILPQLDQFFKLLEKKN